MLLRNKIEVENWLNQYGITNYELILDEKYGYVVNVNDHVFLYNKNLVSIDIKFNEVKGYFNCSENKLKSLEGCPNIVEHGFFCNNNNLNIDGINNLNIIKVKSNYIYLDGNSELEELQKITNFNELKQILTIYKEKNEIMKEIKVTDVSVIEELTVLINKKNNNELDESKDIISTVKIKNKEVNKI